SYHTVRSGSCSAGTACNGCRAIIIFTTYWINTKHADRVLLTPVTIRPNRTKINGNKSTITVFCLVAFPRCLCWCYLVVDIIRNARIFYAGKYSLVITFKYFVKPWTHMVTAL